MEDTRLDPDVVGMSEMSVLARPWLAAGLKYLLTESEDRVRELSRSGPSSSVSRPEKWSGVGGAPQPYAGGNAFARREQAGGRSPSYAVPQQAARTSVPPMPAPQTGKKTARPDVPFEQWGLPWQNLWKRLNMDSRPKVAWTYGALGNDLSGDPDGGRKKVLAHILQALRHPRGTHVFWPYKMPECGTDTDVFWSALHAAGVRVLLVFGSDARDALSLPNVLKPYCHDMLHGCMVVQLQRMETLAAEKEQLNRAVAWLARFLNRCLPSQG